MNDALIALGFVGAAFVGAQIWKVVKRKLPASSAQPQTKPNWASRAPTQVPSPATPFAQAQAVLKHRIEDYGGEFTLKPFGHDLLSPPRRDVPIAYHGAWLSTSLLGVENPEQRNGYARLELSAKELRFNGVSYPVVLVDDTGKNFLPESETQEIAVVCEEMEEDGWYFWMMMLSLQENGQKLVNIESMDSPWTRVESKGAIDSRYDCPYEQLDLTVGEHVAWLKSVRDPELWHVACQASLAYTDDPHGFVPWVVEQRELDRSTAGWIFLWLEGSLYLKGKSHFYHSFSGDAYILEVLNKLAERSETAGFISDRIGLEDRDEGFETERQKCLKIISAGEQSSDRIVPHTLLNKRYPPAIAILNIDNVEGVIIF